MSDNPANTKLEASLEKALLGDRKAIFDFYSALVSGVFFAIKRQQSQPLSNGPKYPSDLFPFLAVQDQGKVVLPIFSSPQKIFDWSGQEFLWQETTAKQLFQLIPTDWYICLNPGSEVEKELTPWEIQELQLGPESIQSLVEEVSAHTELTETNVTTVSELEFHDLKTALIEYAKHAPEISSLQLLKETNTSEDTQNSTLILNVCFINSSSTRRNVLQEELCAVSKKLLIGAENIKIMAIETSSQISEISQLGKSNAFYEAVRNHDDSLFQKLTKLLKRCLSIQ